MGIMSANRVSVPPPKFEYIKTEEEACKTLDYLSKFSVLEVDTEGTGLDPFTCQTTLIQIGIPGKAFVFDVRHDLPDVSIHGSLFKDLFTNTSILKILQNCNYDMKVLKAQFGYYIENVYDTMLVEQLLTLGVKQRGFSLAALVRQYLNMEMDKEPRGTFQDYYQEFTESQLSYAATDVCTLDIIRNMQLQKVSDYNLHEAVELEMQFTKPLAEMELNGITLDIEKWRIIMQEAEKEGEALKVNIENRLSKTQDQTTLFGVASINIDSPAQLLDALTKLGLSLEKTDAATLKRYSGHPVIDDILKYRKLYKLYTTYGEAVIERIHEKTGRLHTQFKQMVSTGRMSSNNPNLQNIPAKQKFRSCFIAGKDKALVTVDQNSAELAIMGDMSGEPNFIETHHNNLDLHTVNASRIFEVQYKEVKKPQRTASKAISFGLAYGISATGLGKRLDIPKDEAQKLINSYFKVNSKLAAWLEESANNAIKEHSSTTITGRRRFYKIPDYSDPMRKKVVGAVKRKAKNHRIQGSDADTIKKAMIICVDKLAKLPYEAKLVLSVHDEIVVECPKDKVDEIAKIVTSSVDEGFNMYFKQMPMYTDAVIGPCWLKGECSNEIDGEECGYHTMEFMPDDHYGSKLICSKCKAFQE